MNRLTNSGSILLGMTVALGLGWQACDAPEAGDAALDGPPLSVDVAALNLQGVGDVVWDIEVVNGATTPQVVWQRRVSSSGYGDGAGSASYIGTCDADPAARNNVVKVWVVGVYSAQVSALGTFSSGAAGGVSGSATPFQNPTETAPLTQTVECLENADVAVQFDVALMRPAQQGFFDVAVNFNNIFCSAKFDCCDDANTNDTCDAGEDIELLFTAGSGRDRTMVLGLACTGGIDATDDTTLYMDPLAFDCTSPASGFSADFTVSPAGAATGNQCVAGTLTGCAAVSDPAQASTYLYQVAVYRGQEQLLNGATSAHKAYWNVALGVTDQIGSCWLRTNATAASAGATSSGFSGGVIAPGSVYPYVQWDVNLGTCASEPLTFDGTGMVRTAYTETTDDDPTAFGYSYAANLAPQPVCVEPCQNGGTCSGPDTCTCPAGYTGDHCETASNLASCLAFYQAGFTDSDVYTIDPDGPGGAGAPFDVYCDMTTDGGGWTLVMKQASGSGYGSPLSVGVWSGWNTVDTVLSPTDATLGDANMVNLAYSRLPATDLRLTASTTWTSVANGGWQRTVNSTAFTALSDANGNTVGNLGGAQTTPWSSAAFTDSSWTTTSPPNNYALCWRSGPWFNQTSYEYTYGGIKWGWFFNNECNQTTTDTGEGLGCCGNADWFRRSPWTLYLWAR